MLPQTLFPKSVANVTFLARHFGTTTPLCWVQHMTRMRVVDNSAIGKQAMMEGKPPKVIGVQGRWKRFKLANLGGRVTVAIKGQVKRGYVVGLVQEQSPMVPRFDSNNLVLVDNEGNPLGTRVHVPVPNYLRKFGGDLHKIIAISSRFV